jgi:SAM-dependent methyltransferase
MIPKPDNTARSFSDKWSNNPDLAFRQTLTEGSDIQNWILQRNGWNNLDDLKTFLSTKKSVLDAGCGNGRVTALLSSQSPASARIVGIDLTAAAIAQKNLSDLPAVTVLRKDLLEDNTDLGKFDFIYCQEVLHHTSDPERSFRNLVMNNLAKDGVIAIYVYRKKAPVREFVDDFVRDAIKGMSYEEAKKKCDQITELGRALAELDVKVRIPQVDILKIEAGEYDIQRFVYHFFMKCFWSPEMSFDANSAINYDWYHPQQCERYEPEEIRNWFDRAGLKVVHEYTDPYGITMHGVLKG